MAGTVPLLRFALRRDRFRLPGWLLGLTALTVVAAVNLDALYPEAADRAAAARTMDTPATIAMSGPRHYLTDYNPGSMTAHEVLSVLGVLLGLMSVLTVVRHTRAEEEANRAELVRAGTVGRHAMTTAALLVACGANLALALLLAVSLAGLGLPGVTLAGALLFGLACASVGIVLAAVAVVTTQLTAHARGASGMAFAVLGLAYALRAAGDVGDAALSWMSPIGWAQRSYPFVDDRWWPLLLATGCALALTALGYLLSTRRDVGAGIRATRGGRTRAGRALATPLGSALRFQRGLLLGFCVATFLLGAMYGAVLGDVDRMLDDMEDIREAIAGYGGTIEDAFASMIMIVVAVVATVCAVLGALRPRVEEDAGRAEPLLATSLSRPRWAGAHLAVALLGGTLALVLGGLGCGVAGAVTTGDAALVGRLAGAALGYAPALWVTAGLAVALYGWLPRATGLVWVLPPYAFVVGYLGEILRLPDWAKNLSPFGHVPRLPAESLTWTPLLLLTALAAALVACGLLGLRARDLRTT
ncbi:ABC transporter permease [Streptomyces sp. AJS327]|nr:ABC transporter permease [Streptomyces sp. AJS327]